MFTVFGNYVNYFFQSTTTLVTLQNISAHLEGERVILSWSTSFETDNEDFVIPARAPSPHDEKFQQGIESQRQTSPETLSDVRDHEAKTQHHVSGSSSFSVSIEDDEGNIIMVRRLEDTGNTSTPSSDLEISEESGRMVLTWQGQGKAKGFILHRAEKGKDNYTPISNLIPYFGRDDKDIFLYRFTDNNAKPGVKYEYRLERVEADHKTGLKIGKLSE